MSDMLKIDDAGGVIEASFIQQDILDEANIQQIGNELNTALEGKAAPKLIIDFGNVRHLSSAALGVLITSTIARTMVVVECVWRTSLRRSSRSSRSRNWIESSRFMTPVCRLASLSPE